MISETEHGNLLEANCEIYRQLRHVTRQQEPRFKRLQIEQITLLLLDRSSIGFYDYA